MLTRPLFAGLLSVCLLSTPVLVFADEVVTTPDDLPVAEQASSVSVDAPMLNAPITSDTQTLVDIGAPATASSTIFMEASSPEPVLPTTSTEPFIASSTNVFSEITETASTTTSALSTGEEPLPLVPTSSTSTLCLAMVAPAPLEGPEWIAVYGLTPSTSAAFIDWSFADAQGSLLKMNASTTLLWDEATQTMRVELRSARLNNDGDTVNLRTPSSTLHDQFIYPETERGHRWSRDSCAEPWYQLPRVQPPETTGTSSSTSVISNVAPSDTVATPVILTETLPTLPTVEAPTAHTETAVSPPSYTTPVAPPTTFTQPPPAMIEKETTVPTQTPTRKTKSTSTPATAKAVVKKTSAKSTKTAVEKTASKTPAKKSTSKASSTKKTTVKKSTPLISLDMSDLAGLPDTFEGIRVRIHGRVASQPNLIAAHTFVIVNEDGRGLLVKGTTKQPSPTFGAWVALTGTVVWNDAGLSLKFAAADKWEPYEPTSTTTNMNAPLPIRTVDLLAPGQEEAWSLVALEGTVASVEKASFRLDVQDTSLQVRVPTRVGYRVQRLKTGDTVSVHGLLDLRGADPVLLPQNKEEIQILMRAPLPVTPEKPPVRQPWLPVGAAAGTLAISEGWRRLKDKRKQQREEAAFQALREKIPQQLP